MASALEKIMKSTLAKSDSQKAFSPWWEDLEDKLLYAIVILGMITLPFNMVSNTPVECTLDQTHPAFKNLSAVDQEPMRYHHFYLRKFCTLNFVHDSMIYLPFLLILAPLPLVGMEKMCLRYFGVLKRMDSFFKLLVKDSLDREDVEALEKEKARSAHELLQMFRESNGVFKAYMAKSLIQIAVASFLSAGLLLIYYFGLSPEQIRCHVFTQHYVCVVPLADFYAIMVLLALVASAGYLACSLRMVAFLLLPNLTSPFYSFMVESARHVDHAITMEMAGHSPKLFTACLPNADSSEPFFDVYLSKSSPDLGLLITMLAHSHGVAEGLRLVAFFDKEFQRLWKPLDFSVECEADAVRVEWNDAPLAAFIHDYHVHGNRLRVEYTLEMAPSDVTEAPLKNHVYIPWVSLNRPKYRDTFYGVHLLDSSEANETGKRSSSEASEAGKKPPYEATVIVSSEINGRTIAQRTEKVKMDNVRKTIKEGLETSNPPS